MSYRSYLLMRALAEGATVFIAAEAVSSTAIEHPEWEDMPHRTYAEWCEWEAALPDR